MNNKAGQYCLIIIMLFIVSCAKEKKIVKAFHYNRTTLLLSDNEKQAVEQTGVKKLYVNFFDAVWDDTVKAPRPSARLKFDKNTWDWLKQKQIEIVPVISISNALLDKVYIDKYKDLAERFYSLLNAQLIEFKLRGGIRELQFNCDWTEDTKEKYFKIIDYIRMLPAILDEKVIVSATIHFNHYKDSDKFGIPPTNRGMLYFPVHTADSLLMSADLIERQLGALDDYALPLDLALPIPGNGVSGNAWLFDKTAASKRPSYDRTISLTYLDSPIISKYSPSLLNEVLSGKK